MLSCQTTQKAQEKEEKEATNNFLTKFFGVEGFTKTENFRNFLDSRLTLLNQSRIIFI